MSENKLEMLFNYGLVLRLPYDKIDTLNQILEENGIRIIYQRPSLGKIIIQAPSGNNEGAEFDKEWNNGVAFLKDINKVTGKTTKICSMCGKEKDVSEFHRFYNKVYSWCEECEKKDIRKPTRLVKKYDEYPYLLILPRDDNAYVWCAYCKKFHIHGLGGGHRGAHCSVYSPHKCKSSFERTGYFLYMPSKKVLKEIRDGIDRYLEEYYEWSSNRWG